MSTVTPPFKVLIAGGSISGLTLALALEHAGIDYELFEKGDIDNDLGAAIAINGSTNRILDQLGVWESIDPIVTDLIRSYRIDGKTGHTILDKNFYRSIQDELRWPWYFIERRILVQKIHSHIKDKSKIHSRLAVQEYEEDGDKITITTSEGTSYTGDILVGADGIHSRVRTLISKHIEKIDEPLSKELNNSFVTEFQVLYGISNHDPNADWLPDAKTVILPYGDHYSGIITKARPDCVFWVLINKVPRTEYAQRLRYTDEDAQNLINEHGDLLVVPGHTIRELWDARIKATLVPMEDGIVKKWSHGRAVLIGDSVHKFTINAGLGGVLAIEAVTQLSNRLVSLVKQNPHPTQQDVTSLFEDFDRAHRPRAEIAHNFSIFITRLETQDNWFIRFFSRYIMPRQSPEQIGQPAVEWALTAPWLEFLPLPERDIDILVKNKKEIEDRAARNSTITWSVVGTGLALATTALIWGWRLKRV